MITSNPATQSDTPIDSLESGPEMDALVAERVMKWREISMESGIPPDCHIRRVVPKYSKSFSVVYEMETEIERQGWHERYARKLCDELFSLDDFRNGVSDGRLWFALRHASAFQCCKAALKAERGHE